MGWHMDQKVLFKHCDPAGIVFFPRYFEMVNDCVESWFDAVLGWPFEELLRDAGVPTVDIRTRFVAPSRHGDRLALRLTVLRAGRTSMTYRMTADCGDERRFEAEATIVHVDATGRPTPWPPSIAATLRHLTEETP